MQNGLRLRQQRTSGGVKSFLGVGILRGWWQLAVDFFVDLLVEVDLFWQGWDSMQGGFADFFSSGIGFSVASVVVVHCWGSVRLQG